MVLDFKTTVDKLESNTEHSLDNQEKKALRSLNKASFKNNKQEWVNYFKGRMVKIGDESVSVDTLARKMDIKRDPNNKYRPIATYNGHRIGRESEVAALLQLYAITTSGEGLRKHYIDGKIGQETATALRGRRDDGEYNSDRSGVKNERERQEKVKDYKVINFIKNNKITITGDSLIDNWIKTKKVTFDSDRVEKGKGNVRIFVKYNGKTTRFMDIQSGDVLDKKGTVNKVQLNREIIDGCYWQVIKETMESFNAEMKTNYTQKLMKVDGTKFGKETAKNHNYSLARKAVLRCKKAINTLNKLKERAIYKERVDGMIKKVKTEMENWYKKGWENNPYDKYQGYEKRKELFAIG